MGTVFNSLLDGPPSGIGKVVVGEEPETDDREPVRMRVAVFFDGTQNNRTNIETRLANVTATVVTINGRPVEVKGSYDSSYSNVAIMEYMNNIEDDQTEVSVYVEGIGTIDNEADDKDGLAWGSGPTGIPAKVTRGITEATTKISEVLRRTEKRLEALTVDVFGFSRGAAAARHFVARRTAEFFSQYPNLSATLGVPPEAITLNFVGVFDTVSSYAGESERGTLVRALGNVIFDTFGDDVDELRLAMHGAPMRAVQLGAADEYRKNFARTTITTSMQAGVGFECTLPGVHSDVGGSYKEEMVETSVVDTYERERLLREGWYVNNDEETQLPEPSGFWVRAGTSTRTTGTRTVRHHYQFIPLSIMMQLAQKFGATFKPFADDFAAYEVPDNLSGLSGLMHRYVLSRHDTALSEPANYVLPKAYKWVRNQYLHRSSVKGWGDMDAITMGGREVDNLPARQIISDLPSR
ncbi:phospholipase effector Tle1 domain-containing protein [Hymenobacter psychrotolerans]|uniref:Uncharacterized alpha/beta hydrolase domain n=1 Tax=Hymenobacter psychrotolerans DSM 18569 TaxID=1121959 RepID=A0A1M7G5N4_9BACT|nr:DUF2235 domain-containing protein [Hymenobacter psychrotolerans]SHM11593.1 Uncharacterized alpha/beta hydrolase domain [Hymenobacter psychrotolerans DSM 18569]